MLFSRSFFNLLLNKRFIRKMIPKNNFNTTEIKKSIIEKNQV